MIYRRAFLVLSVSIVFLLFISCGKRVTTKKDDLLIIAVMPLSGSISYLGQQELGGLLVGVEEINLAGGVNGRPLRVIAEDTQGLPKNAATIAQKYSDRENVICFVVTSSGAVKAVAPILEGRGVPLAAIASDPDMTEQSPVIFRPYMSFATEALILADFIKKKGWIRIAFIRGEAEVFANEAAALRNNLSSSNSMVVADEAYPLANRDFRSILQRIATKKPDVIVALCWGFEVGALLEQKRLDPSMSGLPLVGGYAFLTAPAAKDVSLLMDGNYVVAFSAGVNNPALDALRDKIQAKSGFRPNKFLDFAATYDLPFILAQALAGSSNSNSTIERIRVMGEYRGVAGLYMFKNSLDAQLQLSVMRQTNGQLEIISP
jgi:branched-chain amino acid transport system substrate-binding protein